MSTFAPEQVVVPPNQRKKSVDIMLLEEQIEGLQLQLVDLIILQQENCITHDYRLEQPVLPTCIAAEGQIIITDRVIYDYPENQAPTFQVSCLHCGKIATHRIHEKCPCCLGEMVRLSRYDTDKRGADCLSILQQVESAFDYYTANVYQCVGCSFLVGLKYYDR